MRILDTDMKNYRTYLRPLIALVLALASTPAWACYKACSPNAGADLACVRLCARSQALLTQDGKLDSVGAQACGIQVSTEDAMLSVAPFELAQPEAGLAAAQVVATLDLPTVCIPVLMGRSPPRPSQLISSYHPQANAPPSFC